MDGVSWIKLQTDMFNNRKIKQIEDLPDADSILVIWFKLLFLAGCVNDCGYIYFSKDIPYTEQMLATEFNRPLTTIQYALNIFVRFHMIEIVNDLILVSNWEHYQNADKLAEIREYNRLAKQKSREKQKLLSTEKERTKEKDNKEKKDKDIDIEGVNDVSLTCQGHDTFAEELDSIDARNNQIRAKKNDGKNIPPTLEEVAEKKKKKSYTVDAETFIAHYESNGWMIGKTKMKNWHSALVTWQKGENKKPRYGSTGVQLAQERDNTLDGVF